MAIIRAELVQNGLPQLGGYGQMTQVNNVYDILAEEYDDLYNLAEAGVGSMAYTRQADDGNRRWVKNVDGNWVPVDAEDSDGGGTP